MSLKMMYFCNLLRSGNLPLCLATENGPHQVPRGEPKWKIGTALVSPHLILFLNIKLPFWDIDGATPTYSPTSGYPSTNLTKICHIDQSYPKTEGKTTRKDIKVVPRQEAKPPGKTSELPFLGHRWRNCLLSWDNSDVFPGGFASCLGITLIYVAYFG